MTTHDETFKPASEQVAEPTPPPVPPPGELSTKQAAAATEGLKPHLSRGCVICAGKNFQIGGVVHGLPYSQNGATVMGGGDRVPLLMVVCTQCFNAQFYAAVPLAGVE